MKEKTTLEIFLVPVRFFPAFYTTFPRPFVAEGGIVECNFVFQWIKLSFLCFFNFFLRLTITDLP